MKKCEKFNAKLELIKCPKYHSLDNFFTYSQPLILILKNTKNKRKQK
ncbi:hypothetical protein LBC_00020 [Campylobacter sp. 19-13652]|nr:hypothetical protein LBC_00020 [Campylobacter sp. 19-13652]